MVNYKSLFISILFTLFVAILAYVYFHNIEKLDRLVIKINDFLYPFFKFFQKFNIDFSISKNERRNKLNYLDFPTIILSLTLSLILIIVVSFMKLFYLKD